MTIIPALAFGFTLGVKHATEADHIAAVSTLAGGGSSVARAARLGVLWGAGHSLSVLLVGGALVFLQLPMPARMALGFEFLVALMLIVLGARSLRARSVVAADPPAVRPFLVGVVHGLAGSAVLALLVTGAASTSAAAAVYLACFGAGTMAGMGAVTLLLTLPGRLQPRRAARLERGIRLAAGVASVVIGLLLAHRVGVQDGLFAAAAQSQGRG